MSQAVKVAFASGEPELNGRFLAKLVGIRPDLPLYVVSEFRPEQGRWIPYHPLHGRRENLARCRAALAGKQVRLSAVLMAGRAPRPYRPMKAMALLLSPRGFMGFNEQLNHFMLRPRSAGAILGHAAWRVKEYVRWQINPGGELYRKLWLLRNPAEWPRVFAHASALLGGAWAAMTKTALPRARVRPAENTPAPGGISVVIPSRNGRHLLERLLPGLIGEAPAEIIVVDNGSDDGTAEYLASCNPDVRIERDAAPLSFARAANRGIRAARFSHVLLLNNDMVVERGSLAALRRAFDSVPDLFAATAEIVFPPGARREETGKAVMPPPALRARDDFPLRCDLPVAGEDLSYVLYGSGGCSLYSTAKLRALGGLDEIYAPAYVEDLDAGYRAWLRGWPTVFAAGARVLHEHRATTSRYYSPEDLEVCLETNYLRFLARAVSSPRTFRRLWGEAVGRLNRRAVHYDRTAQAALSNAWRAALRARRATVDADCDETALALGSGLTACFPGRRATGKPVVLIATALLPFPLSHGGAVRMYNLMRRAAAEYDQVLVSFTPELEPPRRELLDICAEIVLVRRPASHTRPRTGRPDAVEEFDSPAFHAALRETARKWKPRVAQFEFTQMAQYAADCSPARTILVEHDITLDLYEQLLARDADFDLRREHERWVRFETRAWREVDAVVAMSEKDRARVTGGRSVCLPNGVDLARFRPPAREPEPGRLLFIGSFRHLPNLLALEFFQREAWPLLARLAPRLHVIAGADHELFLEQYCEKAALDLAQPGIEVEGFVADVRPAYERAEAVIAPLVASAGTNIKVIEAMAMGKAVVSTPAGINGLDLVAGRDLLVASSGKEFAAAVEALLADPARRREIEAHARATAERDYDWDAIAARQRELYESLARSG